MKNLLLLLCFLPIINNLIAQNNVIHQGVFYDLSLNKLQLEQKVLVKERFPVDVKVSFLSYIEEKDVPEIHEKLGNKYYLTIRESVVKSALRIVFGKYKLEEILVLKRELFENELMMLITNDLQKYYIHCDKLVIESIMPSNEIQLALEAKYIALQEEQKQMHLKEVEKQKLEILNMRAKAEAERNLILDKSLTEKVLQQKYIETLEKLAKSENAKVIIFSDEKMKIPQMLKEE